MVRRFSKKRQEIKNSLMKRCDHPTAEAIYEDVKKIYPSISLGTVYRNLGELADSGEILRFSINGTERFDGCVEKHFHLVCRSCGGIFDRCFKTADGEFLENAKDGFIPENTAVTVYGVCKKCAEAEIIN